MLSAQCAHLMVGLSTVYHLIVVLVGVLPYIPPVSLRAVTNIDILTLNLTYVLILVVVGYTVAKVSLVAASSVAEVTIITIALTIVVAIVLGIALSEVASLVMPVLALVVVYLGRVVTVTLVVIVVSTLSTHCHRTERYHHSCDTCSHLFHNPLFFLFV